jgi:hypothetical protein
VPVLIHQRQQSKGVVLVCWYLELAHGDAADCYTNMGDPYFMLGNERDASARLLGENR